MVLKLPYNSVNLDWWLDTWSLRPRIRNWAYPSLFKQKNRSFAFAIPDKRGRPSAKSSKLTLPPLSGSKISKRSSQSSAETPNSFSFTAISGSLSASTSWNFHSTPSSPKTRCKASFRDSTIRRFSRSRAWARCSASSLALSKALLHSTARITFISTKLLVRINGVKNTHTEGFTSMTKRIIPKAPSRSIIWNRVIIELVTSEKYALASRPPGVSSNASDWPMTTVAKSAAM
mmetsp:Transcript_12033/g.26768  ORF Transcript_12033/g.26768 Transcript_12033/m.26768 type:complete len:232 (-) Transcript_12033:1019-1714(-)